MVRPVVLLSSNQAPRERKKNLRQAFKNLDATALDRSDHHLWLHRLRTLVIHTGVAWAGSE